MELLIATQDRKVLVVRLRKWILIGRWGAVCSAQRVMESG